MHPQTPNVTLLRPRRQLFTYAGEPPSLKVSVDAASFYFVRCTLQFCCRKLGNVPKLTQKSSELKEYENILQKYVQTIRFHVGYSFIIGLKAFLATFGLVLFC